MDWMLTIAKDSNNELFVRRALDRGIHLFRINMAYHEDALKAVSLLRKYKDRGISVFYDYPGPKMRIQLRGKDYLKFPEVGKKMVFTYFQDDRFPYITNLPQGTVKTNNHLSIADGKIKAHIIEANDNGFTCIFTDVNYELRDNAGCSLSGDNAYIPSFNYNDLQKIYCDLASLDTPDWLIISFVDNPEIIQELRRESLLKGVSIMAKIETPAGVSNIKEISAECEGIMIGRGDLRNTAGTRYDKYLSQAIEKAKQLSGLRGIGTFFLGDLSQRGTISKRDEKDLEYADGLDFVMLSKEVVNSNYHYAVLDYIATRLKR